jgi:hypothetical protein
MHHRNQSIFGSSADFHERVEEFVLDEEFEATRSDACRKRRESFEGSGRLRIVWRSKVTDHELSKASAKERTDLLH